MEKLVGIEIGGTKLQIVLGGLDLEIENTFRFTVKPSEGASGIRRHIEESLRLINREHQLLAVGIGFGGPIDWRTGQVICSHHVEGWNDFSFREWIGSIVSAPVFADNDGNVAALGEFIQGAGLGSSPMFYVTLGSGVGGGLVVDGKIYHGDSPGESEIGHVRLDKSGRIVEQSCSGWAVDRKIRVVLDSGRETVLRKMVGNSPGNEARFLSDALQIEDPEALRIVDETADDLAFGLSHVTHLMHPKKIVLGGGLALLGEVLRARVANCLPRYLMEAFGLGPEIVLSSLKERAVPVGALALARAGVEGKRAKRASAGC